VTATAYVKNSRLRVGLRRHPWVYDDAVTKIQGEYENGDVVTVRSEAGKFLAHGFVNDASRLALRLVSFEKSVPITDDLLRERVRDAVALRHDSLRLRERTNAYRVIHSEGDGLPGLIVDRYDDVLALSCSSLGTQRRLDPIVSELLALLEPSAILELGVSEGLRGSEGLPPGRGLISGVLAHPLRTVSIDGLHLHVPLTDGQKTGLFLDQRDNVRLLAGLAPGRRVLDACCYVGAFGLACAQAGARSVLAFDSSEAALELAIANAEMNGVADRVELVKGSLFRELRDRSDAGQTFDLIVLDPPKFAAKARDVKKARKGYLDANMLALKMLTPGGLLLTCSCSHHVGVEMLEGILSEAATRTSVRLRVLERRGAGLDHPVDVHCPEGRYLKAILAQRAGE